MGKYADNDSESAQSMRSYDDSERADAHEECEQPGASILKKQQKTSKSHESVLKKRTRKQSQMTKCDFLDFEA